MAELAFDIMLCGLILGTAISTVAGRTLFAAVVFLIVYGIFIAIGWLRLGAVDVALTEAAIGAGLTGLLVLRVLGRLPAEERPKAPPPRLLIAIVAAATSLALGWAFLELPPANGLAKEVLARRAEAGAENPVTAVLLNFRGWDTLLESIVLLAALVGVWALARDEGSSGRIGSPQRVRPTGVLANFGRVLPPVGLMIGVYLVWAGTSSPGGAFQGGTVLAAVALLVSMAGLIKAPRVTALWLRAALVVGPMLFLAVGLTGAVLAVLHPESGAQFLGIPTGMAKPILLGIEAMLTVSIAVSLAALVAGPPEEEEPE